MKAQRKQPAAKTLPATPDPRILRACSLLTRHCAEPWPLAKLARRVGLSPYHLQRRFTATVGVSPKAFQAAERIRVLKARLRDGQPIVDASQDAGFSSSSRLHESAERQLGMTPRAYRRGGEGEVVSYATAATDLGTLLVAATDRGLCSVQFGSQTNELLANLRREFPAAQVSPMPAGQAPQFEAWMQQLRRHLQGLDATLALPLDLRGTAFQLAVWRYLQKIPYGSVVTYGAIAQQLGRPRAVRAVANACAGNRIAVLIPCHRVVRGDGSMGGYRWGVRRKRALLEVESAAAGRGLKRNDAMAPARS